MVSTEVVVVVEEENNSCVLDVCICNLQQKYSNNKQKYVMSKYYSLFFIKQKKI